MNNKPVSMHVNLDDFIPASPEDKEYLTKMRPSSTFFKDGVKRLLKNKVATISAIFVIIITIGSIVIPFFWPYGYEEMLGVSQGGSVVHYYLPAVRRSDSKPGLDDCVTGVFFVNLGTGADFNQVVYVSDRATIYSVIAHTNCVSTGSGVLPDGFGDDRLVTVPLTGQHDMRLGYIKLRSVPLSDSGREFVEILQQILKELEE